MIETHAQIWALQGNGFVQGKSDNNSSVNMDIIDLIIVNAVVIVVTVGLVLTAHRYEKNFVTIMTLLMIMVLNIIIS